MSTTTTTTTSSAALPSIKVTKPFARTSSASIRSKVIPKTKPVPGISSSSSTGTTSTSDGITSTAGKTGSMSKSVTAQSTQETNAPIKARLPSSAPFDIKKIRAFIAERPDLRKTSTSTVGSTTSTSSIMSKASTSSTVSSFDTGSIASTETVRPKAKVSAKPKVFPVTAPTLASASASQMTKKVPLPVKKVATTLKKPAKEVLANEKTQSAESDAAGKSQDVKQVKVPKLVAKSTTKKVVKKKPKQSAEAVDTQPDTIPTATETLPASKPVKNAQSKTATTTNKLEVKNNSIPKGPTLQASSTSADSSSNNAIEPSRKKVTVPTTSASSETAAPILARKKPKLSSMKSTVKTQVQPDTKPLVQSAASFPKSCMSKSVHTTQQKIKNTTGSTKSLDPNMTPAKVAARRAVSAPIPLLSALSRAQKNEVQIPPTPKSSRASRTKHISTTPLPNKSLQPRIEAPLTRRKSVSFKSPLEAFQIIPARRPSRSPPRSASKKVMLAPLPTKSAMPTIKEHEIRPPTPFAPSPSNEDDDHDLVFQDQEDPNDRLSLGLSIPAKDVITEEPVKDQPNPEQPPEPILTDDGNFDNRHDENLPEATPATSELTVDKSDEAITKVKIPPPPPPTEDEPPELAEAEAETEPEVEAFDPEIPDNEDEEEEEEEDDESTVFYDADESYIPQYSSPRKPITPRSTTGTPLGSLTVKMVKSPRLVTENGSPKLDLLRLCSPTKKRKMKKAAGSVSGGDELGVEGVRKSAKSPLFGEEVSV